MTKLLKKISNKQAKIGIVGLGYVGLPLACEFAAAGFQVLGVDISHEKIASLKKKVSYVLDVPTVRLKKLIDTGRMEFSSDYSLLRKADCISIAVPTPLRKTKEPDVSYIVNSMAEIRKILHKGMLIVLESTTYPGTTRELVAQVIEKSGFKVGTEILVAFSPERVDPGNPKYHTKNTPKVIGGITAACTEAACQLYSSVIDTVVKVDSAEEAEMVKLLENTYRAVNIALVNEMALMCDRMGINIWNVISAAATKPFGFMSFYPGPGIGGHCIPLDPTYLSWKAKMFDFYNRFIELATDINGNMPRFVLQKLARIMNREKILLNGSKILLLGVAYKPDINDLRESPALEVYRLLRDVQASVDYFDPYVKTIREGGKIIKSIQLTAAAISKYDAVIVTTRHRELDYELVLKHAGLIFDTRDAYHGIQDKKIHRL
ncbi:MAG: nucleotide sugar dehydrogenase [Candidatus Wallbacteria bacterium]|nr:nucleotide sugar dehydrogenase [Candidatus Wallbacteria bacterium]